MLLSVFVALSLTPALCAMMLKPASHGGDAPKKGFFGAFNRTFERGRDKYVGGVRHVISGFARWLLIYGALIVAVGLLFVRLPTGFLPDEDQGTAFVQVQAPSGATHGQTHIALDDVANYLLHEEADAVECTFEIAGFNFAGRGQSQGLVFVRFKDWSVRTHADLKAQAGLARPTKRFASSHQATIVTFDPPAIPDPAPP